MIVYTHKESKDTEALNKSFIEAGVYKDTVFDKVYNNELPAVYNINIDALATITCPFFTFLEPFQEIKFASRYALTSLVDYFASYAPNIYRFFVIKTSISFATEEALNEVQIVAISEKGDKNE